MIPAKSCHYTTKFNSERHKSTKIFSIHSSKILFFPYSLYHQAFQDPPCRHRRSKINTPPSSMQAHFVNASIRFAVYLRTCPYLRCKITSNPSDRPIWFVIYPLLFADAAFCISNTQHLLKIASISALFFQNPCTIQINALPLHHKNPPSLSTMLKSAGRFIL